MTDQEQFARAIELIQGTRTVLGTLDPDRASEPALRLMATGLIDQIEAVCRLAEGLIAELAKERRRADFETALNDLVLQQPRPKVH